MFSLSNICGCVPTLVITRGISCGSKCMNHYLTLGLTPAATQGEIKEKYFELCKKHHPDKNQGSRESVKMFRKISEAYEILGNERSRKLYDNKMLYTGPTTTHTVHQPEDYNYEAERYFYERTNLRKRFTGRTKYYDFDAWNKAHYPKSKNKDERMERFQHRNWRTRTGSGLHSQEGIQITAKYILTFIVMCFLLVNVPAYLSTFNYGVSFDCYHQKKVYSGSRSTDDE